MPNNKKILIIGNGFDLNLGRPTRYKDFYESSFCPKDYPAPLIEHLNKKWETTSESVRWYDLENELSNYYFKLKEESSDTYGNYSEIETKILTTIQRQTSVSIYDDILKNNAPVVVSLIKQRILKKEFSYIQLTNPDVIYNACTRDKIAFGLIKQRLIEYFKELEKQDILENSIAAKVAKEFLHPRNRNYIIYSFNYTPIKTSNATNKISNSKILYVHGNCQMNNIILGTKDDKFDTNYDFLQKSFDTNFNPPTLVYDLNEANDITIFGHSLGQNDSQYLKSFFQKQSSLTPSQKKNITIFTKDENSEIEIKRSLQQMTNFNLSTLYSMNNLEIIKTDDCDSGKYDISNYLKRIQAQTSRGVSYK